MIVLEFAVSIAVGTVKNEFDNKFYLKPDHQYYQQKHFIISSDILLRNSRDSAGYFRLMMDFLFCIST
jgi:hypothetical protein